MILHEITIDGTTTPITILPLGDIQWNGDRREIAFDMLHEHIANVLKLPNPHFLGTGDYIDFASPSNRAELRSAKVYQGPRKVINDAAEKLVDEVYKVILKPTTGKWAGLVRGHHWYPLASGGTTDHALARMLGTRYLGHTSIVRFSFVGEKRKHVVDVWVSHGEGGSSLPSGPVTKLAPKANYWDVDVMIMGHMTRKAMGEVDRCYPVFPVKGTTVQARLQHRVIKLVGAGGWAKGFVEGDEDGTYVEQKWLNSVTLGAPIIHVRPRWRNSSRDGVKIWEPRITVEA